jgi:hypothetical protein
LIVARTSVRAGSAFPFGLIDGMSDRENDERGTKRLGSEAVVSELLAIFVFCVRSVTTPVVGKVRKATDGYMSISKLRPIIMTCWAQ